MTGSRPKLVHRLDKDTSGALLVARSARAAGHFAKAFAGRTARKVYWALIVGVPSLEEGLIDAAAGQAARAPAARRCTSSEEAGLPAKTRWRLIDRAGNRAAWVELQPLTGRTHQLRAHMAAIGHPIVGDAKYGGPEAFLTGGISRKLHLHARRIRIDAPDGGAIDVTAELPPHFAESLATLGFEPMAGDMLPLDQSRPGQIARGQAAPRRRGRQVAPPRAQGRAAQPRRGQAGAQGGADASRTGASTGTDRAGDAATSSPSAASPISSPPATTGLFVVHAPVAGDRRRAGCNSTSRGATASPSSSPAAGS